MDPEKTELQKKLAERFAELPKVVQNAITSAEVEKHMRELADTHKLHLDQWDLLENEVMLTLLGFQSTDSLPTNIEKEVGVDHATASALAAGISKIVFEPIRTELERELEHPDAAGAATSGVDTMRTQMLAGEATKAAPPAPLLPATPPPPKNEVKVERASIPATYAPQVASRERKTVAGDPYREQLS